MKSQTDAEHFCIFPPPHGQIKKFLGIVKVNAEQRLAVGLCPFDWNVPEMEPLLKWEKYTWDRRFLLPPTKVEGKIHPPNTLAYCEYHGGTQREVAAGEWCEKCQAVRRWALSIIRSFSENFPPGARAIGLRGTFKNRIINPDVMNWTVALGVLGLFPDVQSQSVLKQEFIATPEVSTEDIKNYVQLGWEKNLDAMWTRLRSTH